MGSSQQGHAARLSKKRKEKKIQGTDTWLQSSNQGIMVVLCNAYLGKVSLSAEAGWLQKT